MIKWPNIATFSGADDYLVQISVEPGALVITQPSTDSFDPGGDVILFHDLNPIENI
jgi:hypothetical protein